MSAIFSWICNNYNIVISIISMFTAIVVFIVKKRPLGNVFALIFRYCLAAVVMAEEHPVKGKEKLELAIDAVNEMLLSEYPTLKVNQYRDVIVSCIEAILATPHKKEVK